MDDQAIVIEHIDISSLSFDPVNARKHNQKNLDAIKGSLAKFGQQKPIVINKNNIVIAGNGTLDAARALGWKKISAVRTTLDQFNQSAYGIADNRSGELAEWDMSRLPTILSALDADGFDLNTIGWDDLELEALIVPATVFEPGCDQDDVPDVKETRCKVGDLWRLGEHRLLCGDSTNIQHVERLMGGEKAHSLITDPPYGVNLGKHGAANETRDGFQKRKGYRTVDNSLDAFKENVVPAVKYGIEITDRAAVFGVPPNVWDFPPPDVFGGVYVSAATGRNAWGFSNFWVVLLYGARPDLHKGSYPVVLNSNAAADKVDHPTSKPIEWMAWLVEMASREKENVLELFCGSGSTLIACEKTNRRCFGMEIDPHYCDVIITRWETYTGKKAELIND